MIEVKSLTRRFGPFTAVDRLTFSVGAGEVLGFLGPNGAGKSTTMKMLTGFLEPSAGTATILGHDIRRDRLAAQREIGYLPEGAPLYGEMTVLQFLEFIAEVRGFHGVERRAKMAAAMARLQLDGVAGQTIETLSKGFKRRVGLAQAILHDPRVLILDEPTDGLDPNQKHEVRKLIGEMAAERIIVISTHILEEVHAVCTRAMIIAAGRLVADDTPDGLARQSRYYGALTFQVDAPQQAASELASLAVAGAVEVNGNEVTVFPKNGGDLLGAVQKRIAERGWQVGGLRLENGRLDEVFRNITRDALAGDEVKEAA